MHPPIVHEAANCKCMESTTLNAYLVKGGGGRGEEEATKSGTKCRQICLSQGARRTQGNEKADQMAKAGAELGGEGE